jgi:hypothetical protein
MSRSSDEPEACPHIERASIEPVELQEFLLSSQSAQTALDLLTRSRVTRSTDIANVRDNIREAMRLNRFGVFAWLMQNGVHIPARLLDDRVHRPVGQQHSDLVGG